ncbi:hypothetical protein IV203_009333 [Nitzschia inconspicua]|uniref:Uncharacterized protein n=1 Tax=Nitzschia inconspicua TaxID=303405 RepID=A0A9K3L0B1_9STRA|nr:hypothetical protein IV203_009333 [Nitzschia inconspicua]
MNNSSSGRSSVVGHKQTQRRTPSCLLCYSMEMTMMDLFSPAELENDDGSVNENNNNKKNRSREKRYSLFAESKDEDDSDDQDDDSSSSSDEATDTDTEECTSQDSSVARKVCKLWRRRRRQEKEKTRQLRQELGILVMPDTTTTTTTVTPPTTTKYRTTPKTVSVTMVHATNKPYDEAEEWHRLEKQRNKAKISKMMWTGRKKSRTHVSRDCWCPEAVGELRWSSNTWFKADSKEDAGYESDWKSSS